MSRRGHVAVAGAGPVGLILALALRDHAVAVTLIDDGGRPAAWSSGGMLSPTHECLLGGARDTALIDLAFEGLAAWPDLARGCGVRLEAGAWFIARATGEADALAACAPEAARRGAPLVEAGMPDGLNGLAAWRTETEMRLDPRAALVALRAAALARGVRIVAGAARDFSNGRIVLADGTGLEADLLVWAGGAAAALEGGAPEQACLQPVKGQMLAFARDTAAVGDVPWTRAGRLYLLPRGGRLVAGATSEPDFADAGRVDATAIAALAAEARALAPGLAGARIVESWSGLRPATPDGLPMLGPSRRTGHVLAAGAFRNGWLLAPAIAVRLTAWLTGAAGAEQGLAPFLPGRFGL